MSFRTERLYLEFLQLTRRLSNSQIMMVLAVVVGVLAGLGTYLFEILLHGIKSGLIRWFPVDSAHVLFLIYPAVGIILATLFVKYIVRDNISEGVTRVLHAMSRRNSRIAGHNCWTSVVGGATTIGFGGSVGPEAPIVLTGAAIGSNIGRLARLNYKHTTLLLCCGAGAALAAIFKAPITGVVFVLEILMLDITAGSVIPLLIASITATTMAFMLRGFDPILAVTLAPADAFELWQIPLFILLGQRQRRRLDRFDIAVAANRERERADAEHLLQIRLYLKRILAVEMDVHAVMGLFIVQRRKSAQRVFHVIEQLLDEILAVLSLRGKLAVADQDMIVNKVILWHNLL